MAKKKLSAAQRQRKAAAKAAQEHQNGHTNGDEHSSDNDSVQEVPDTRSDAEKAVDAKEKGNAAFKAAKYNDAIRLYTQAITLVPDEPAYLTNRAASLMALKQHKQALADCQRAAALQSKHPQAKTLARMGRCQLSLGELKAAATTLAQALELDPANASAKTDAGKIDRLQKAVADITRERANKSWTMVTIGLDQIEREIEQPPTQWKAWRVEALAMRNKMEEANSLASDLLRSQPDDPEALYARGLVLYLQGNLTNAVTACQQALRRDPDFLSAKLLMKKAKLLESTKLEGNAAFQKQDWSTAIEKYTAALAIDPDNSGLRITLLSNRAAAYVKMSKNEEAIADCDAILDVDDNHFKAFRARARARLAMENYEGAVQDFTSAYKAAPHGGNDQRSLESELRSAKADLKRSKTKDYYKILGVTKDASDDEIRKAYKKKSLQLHPDKNRDNPNATEEFHAIGEAYEILSDPRKKARYDSGADDDEMGGFGDFGGFGGGGFGGFHGHSHGGYDDYGGGFGGGINLEDLLNGMGGGGRRGGHPGFGFQF